MWVTTTCPGSELVLDLCNCTSKVLLYKFLIRKTRCKCFIVASEKAYRKQFLTWQKEFLGHFNFLSEVKCTPYELKISSVWANVSQAVEAKIQWKQSDSLPTKIRYKINNKQHGMDNEYKNSLVQILSPAVQNCSLET